MTEAPADQNVPTEMPAWRTTTAHAGAIGSDLPEQSGSSGQEMPAQSESNSNTFEPSPAIFSAPSPHREGATSTANLPPAAVKTPATAGLVETLGLGLQRIQQSGNNRVDLKVPLEGGGEVGIQLRLEHGRVQACVTTDSIELREALQKGWAQLATRSETAGAPLAHLTFRSFAENSTAFSEGQHRERQPEPHHDRPTYTPSRQLKRPRRATAITRASTNHGLTTWA
jgi:hypothetical protein